MQPQQLCNFVEAQYRYFPDLIKNDVHTYVGCFVLFECAENFRPSKLLHSLLSLEHEQSVAVMPARLPDLNFFARIFYTPALQVCPEV